MRNSEIWPGGRRASEHSVPRVGNLLAGIALVAALAFAFVPTGAAALDMRKAGTVVTILERLSVESGKTVYFDEEAAAEWFEIDEEASRLIPASGFTRTSWKDAFDQTMAGFIAAIPPVELETMIDEFATRLGEAAKMTTAQKQAAREMLRAHAQALDNVRKRGEQYRDAMLPYVARMKKLSNAK
ncbi:hypothetical protein ASE63_23140 [Bosea sp. Root381]|nr:hypothetical protein ASE63_23140 [Bosea sp. Root381]